MPDRELLLERLERLAIVLDDLMPECAEALLKEQEDGLKHYDDGSVEP